MAKVVTVVTPSFNQARFLPAALASVLSQDYQAVEYIVVDGGSADESVNIIRRVSHHLAWWTSEKDSGQAEAINKGMARARGEYVAWLNSDDVYLPGAIRRAVRILDDRPDVGLVYANGLIIDQDGRVEHRPRSRQYTLVDLLGMSILHQPTVFMRRNVFERVGGLDPTYHLLLDHHLWIRIALVSGIHFADEYWAAARRHGAAKNSTRSLEFVDEAARIHRELGSQPKIASLLETRRRLVEAGYLLFEAGYLIGAGDDAKALRRLWQALLANPRRARQCAKLALLAVARLGGGTRAERLLYAIRDRLLHSRYPGPLPEDPRKDVH
jgi:glycosyltransferase involved in cell wall biosynthesis